MTWVDMMVLNVRQIFTERKALLKGHFLLSSGLHSELYLQAAKVLQFPELASQLGEKLAEDFKDLSVNVVVAPALGGVLVAFEVARALGVRSLFVERVNGVFHLRRGFEIKKSERVLVVEDVLTTGKSTREVVDVVQKSPGHLVGVGCLIDRSSHNLDFGVPLKSLLKLEVQTFNPADCPDCQEGMPLVKPGSR